MIANELRISNLVELFGTREVIAIKENKIKVRHESSKGHFIVEWCPITSLSLNPIPLTEEWLLKCGFEKQKTIISGNVYSIKINKNNNWFSVHEQSEYDDPNSLSLKELKKWWSFNDNRYEVKIKSIHQLQNLYFALTREELIIK